MILMRCYAMNNEQKEQNFISAVVYLDDNSINIEKFIMNLYECLNLHFMNSEIIAVNNGTKNNINNILSRLKDNHDIDSHVTVINMSLRQSHEQCMNAGLDLSIGDYVYEFDSINAVYDFDLIWKAYEAAMNGNDIVAVCPEHENIMSRIFYRTFNKYSNSAYKLRTNAFTLISRRAINRVHSSSINPAYRKAVYSSIGLKMSEIEFDGKIKNNEDDKFSLAVDSLVLYTDFGYKFSLNFALFMMLLTLCELVYTLIIWITGNPVLGWTTMMFVMTLGLTGLFGVFAVVLKYLTLIIRLFTKKNNYLVESIEKI